MMRIRVAIGDSLLLQLVLLGREAVELGVA